MDYLKCERTRRPRTRADRPEGASFEQTVTACCSRGGNTTIARTLLSEDRTPETKATFENYLYIA